MTTLKNAALEVLQVEQQGPKAGEARVRVKAAGICDSDWHVINGDWTMPLWLRASSSAKLIA